jgi:hypothetical protein
LAGGCEVRRSLKRSSVARVKESHGGGAAVSGDAGAGFGRGGGRDTRNNVGAPRYGRCHACLALAPVCVCSLEGAMCADTLSPSGVPVSEDRDRDRVRSYILMLCSIDRSQTQKRATKDRKLATMWQHPRPGRLRSCKNTPTVRPTMQLCTVCGPSVPSAAQLPVFSPCFVCGSSTSPGQTDHRFPKPCELPAA